MSQARSDCRAMPAPNSSSRERKAELLAEILRESRVTVLCGAAGAGKSQFLR
jgi:tRNA A37 threonylcarbamoyladenosine biosynthesis protein TsaE